MLYYNNHYYLGEELYRVSLFLTFSMLMPISLAVICYTTKTNITCVRNWCRVSLFLTFSILLPSSLAVIRYSSGWTTRLSSSGNRFVYTSLQHNGNYKQVGISLSETVSKIHLLKTCLSVFFPFLLFLLEILSYTPLKKIFNIIYLVFLLLSTWVNPIVLGYPSGEKDTKRSKKMEGFYWVLLSVYKSRSGTSSPFSRPAKDKWSRKLGTDGLTG